jgi:hypothetical protein
MQIDVMITSERIKVKYGTNQLSIKQTIPTM